MRVLTRQSEDFDILTQAVDPARSPYARLLKGYVSKIRAFYDELGVGSAIWAVPAAQPPQYLQPSTPIEYVLEIAEARIVAYVDELSWSPYVEGKRNDFMYSRKPAQYEMTSVLVAVPINNEEVIAVRRYRRTKGVDCYELEEWPW